MDWSNVVSVDKRWKELSRRGARGRQRSLRVVAHRKFAEPATFEMFGSPQWTIFATVSDANDRNAQFLPTIDFGLNVAIRMLVRTATKESGFSLRIAHEQ